MEGSIEDFCYRILDLHKGIRFAGLASSSGRLVSQAYRRGLTAAWNLGRRIACARARQDNIG